MAAGDWQLAIGRRYIGSALPMREKTLIERVRRASLRAQLPGAVLRGIGDDCAVVQIPAGHEALVTTDFSLEGTHFRREWHPAESAGHRCLARGLSDIAAMGGEPIAAFLSLALPASLPQHWVDRFLAGFLKLAREFQVPLAGGDTAESTAGVLADVVVLGAAPAGEAVLRSGARPGDGIYVTGVLGQSAAVLEALRAGRKMRPQDYPAHFFPMPRLAVGCALRQKRLASAMIDVSDGLSTDLEHICEESGVGAVMYADLVPCAEISTLSATRPRKSGSVRVAEKGGAPTPALQFALHGGEDYELLFTSSGRVPAKIAGVKVTRIGEITGGRKVVLVDSDGKRKALRPAGWEHFRRQ
jgi:thiamine-monophosphate kinase